MGELHVVIPVQDYNDGNDDVDDERKIVIEFQAIILFIYIYICSFCFFLFLFSPCFWSRTWISVSSSRKASTNCGHEMYPGA